jgi:hypothetical protein
MKRPFGTGSHNTGDGIPACRGQKSGRPMVVRPPHSVGLDLGRSIAPRSDASAPPAAVCGAVAQHRDSSGGARRALVRSARVEGASRYGNTTRNDLVVALRGEHGVSVNLLGSRRSPGQPPLRHSSIPGPRVRATAGEGALFPRSSPLPAFQSLKRRSPFPIVDTTEFPALTPTRMGVRTLPLHAICTVASFDNRDIAPGFPEDSDDTEKAVVLHFRKSVHESFR